MTLVDGDINSISTDNVNLGVNICPEKSETVYPGIWPKIIWGILKLSSVWSITDLSQVKSSETGCKSALFLKLSVLKRPDKRLLIHPWGNSRECGQLKNQCYFKDYSRIRTQFLSLLCLWQCLTIGFDFSQKLLASEIPPPSSPSVAQSPLWLPRSPCRKLQVHSSMVKISEVWPQHLNMLT